ncbi:cyclase family protein [Kyrpidia spormannii]|nr:cyclase family protein [Kyrpidia spormannii]
MFRPRKIVDLSMPIRRGMPVYPGDPQPDLQPAATLDKDGFNVSHLHLGTHTGTHVDAPYHFSEGGARIDSLPLEWFVGTGLIIPVPGKRPRECICLEEVAPWVERAKPGQLVLFATGWWRKAGEADYVRHPYVEVRVIEALLERGVRVFGIDAMNIDPTGETDYPVHRAITAAGGIIIENLCNLNAVDFADPVIVVFPLRIEGADGSPVRAVAMDLGDGGSAVREG